MTETRKLYDTNAYRIEFEATVLSCRKGKKDYEILLDQTVFFPEEGGQTSDVGNLFFQTKEKNDQQKVNVNDVQINRENVITHLCDNEIPEGTKVHGMIDWTKRFSDMQQHSGEHIVSGLIYQKFGLHNVGFHLSKREVTMDFDGVLSWENIVEIEKKANQAIYENFSVEIEYPDTKTLETIEYRSKKELEGLIRIVTFPGYDICACCAPHVHHTGEIGVIKIIHLMRYKGGVRLNLLCGSRALEDMQNKTESVLKISSLLSARPEDVGIAVSKLQDENLRLKEQLAMQEKEKITKIAESISKGSEPICLFEKELSIPAQRELANILADKRSGYCGVFVGTDKEGYRYILSTATGDARELNQQLKEKCSAQGGGSALMTQGSLKGTSYQIQEIFQTF